MRGTTAKKSIEWDYGLFDWKELDGKSGKISVGVDHSAGRDYTAVVFTSEDGTSYLIHMGQDSE